MKFKEMMGRKPQITVGADPEIFVENVFGKIIPAFSFLPEQKDGIGNLTSEFRNYGMSYHDGLQAEFTILEGGCLEEMCNYNFYGLKRILDEAIKFDPSAKLSAKTCIEIPTTQLKFYKENTIRLGCKPSFNAYGLDVQFPSTYDATIRSTGGHMHFGYIRTDLKLSKIPPYDIAKALDRIIGIISVSLFAGYENPIRRKFYGLPGEFRVTPYGMEYRTLSNAWLFHPIVTHLVWDLARLSLLMLSNGLINEWKCEEDRIIHTILNCDIHESRKIINENCDLLLSMLARLYNSDTINRNTTGLYGAILGGVDSFISDFRNIEKSWCLREYNPLNGIARHKVINNIQTIADGVKI